MKPRIKFQRDSRGSGFWWCATDEESGIGDTPQEAFEMWKTDPMPF